MKLKKILERLVQEKAPGPSPAFTVFDIIRVLSRIAKGPIGRVKLAKELKIGEGTMRTIISRLKEAELIEISKYGCFLTKKGEKTWKEIKGVFRKMVVLRKNEFSFAPYTMAILVKEKMDMIKAGMEQRDAAIMAGAKSATTIVMKNGKLIVPAISENMKEDYPLAYKQIMEHLEPEEKDVIIIGSAETLEKAEYGTLAAAWTLVEDC